MQKDKGCAHTPSTTLPRLRGREQTESAAPSMYPSPEAIFRRLGVAGMKAYFSAIRQETDMKIKVVVHEADEGGFWAEVPAIPSCATQGETMDELLRNLHEAIEGCLSVDVAAPKPGGKQRILEIAV
jgi:predicted RNase H-like HicB family nuclease